MTKPSFNQPLSGNDMPRFSGPGSMFRLPYEKTAENLDIAIIGIGLDIGTSNRNGARFGPRQIRNVSAMVRPYGMATQAAPFDSFQIADIRMSLSISRTGMAAGKFSSLRLKSVS